MNENKIKPFNVAYNLDAFTDFYYRMQKICLSMFEWENLPSSMDARYLELCLFEDGQASVLKTKLDEYQEPVLINTRCSDNGKLNLYYMPTKLRCFGADFNAERIVYNGLKDESIFTEDNQAVHILNDSLRIPTWVSVYNFAERLSDTQKTCDINIRAQRTPVLILGSKKQKETLKSLYAQYDGFEPVIMGDDDYLSQDSIKAVVTGAPYVADKIQSYKKEIWNEFLTSIGINNIDLEKKERLISGESNANNELINFNLQNLLAPRQKACEQINKLFGTNISVKVRSDLFNIIKQQQSIIDNDNNGIDDRMEGEENA